MINRRILVTLVAASGLLLTGCASATPSTGDDGGALKVTRSVDFQVESPDTGNPNWGASSARGIHYDDGETVLRVGIDTRNQNGEAIIPVATVTFPDGSTLVCSDDDPRHTPYLNGSWPDVDLPCPSDLPVGVTGGTVTVIDQNA